MWCPTPFASHPSVNVNMKSASSETLTETRFRWTADIGPFTFARYWS